MNEIKLPERAGGPESGADRSQLLLSFAAAFVLSLGLWSPGAAPFSAGLVSGLLAQPGEDPPGAFELLEKVRGAYADGGSESGSIDRRISRQGVEISSERLRFQVTGSADGVLRFRLEPEEREGRVQVIWTDSVTAFHYSEALGQFMEVREPARAMAESLGIGGEEALVAARLLAGGLETFPDPASASSEGPTPCSGEEVGLPEPAAGDGDCFIVTAVRLSGAVEAEYFIDAATFRLRRVLVRLASRDEVLAAAAAQAGLRPPEGFAAPGSDEETRLSLVHDPEAPETRLTGAFEPPAKARRVEAWQAVAPGTEASRPVWPEDATLVGGEGPRASFADAVEVRLQTLQVRAVEWDGTPIKGLGPEDFRVRLGRKEVEVQSADWISSSQPRGSDLPPEVLAEAGITVDPPGKLVLFFVQAGLQGTRGSGHVKLLREARRVLDSLEREDRAAVVSFDSHLKLRQDFTRDMHKVHGALEDSIFRRKASPPTPGRYPSLGRYIDAREAKDAAIPEKGLLLASRALERLQGERVVIYVGWGLGNYRQGGVSMPQEYFDALEFLRAANASVFVLDVSQVDFHTLELGLKQVAQDTGGQYFSTYKFATQVVNRLSRSIGGRYELVFERPRLKRQTQVRVELVGRDGRVLYPEALPPDAEK